MDLNPYLGAVAADLEKATALADDATRAVTARVAVAVEPALRLAMTQLLADAAAQLSSELAMAVITVRMDGREPVLRVEEQTAPVPDPTAAEPTFADDEGTARVTVRLPEQLKRRAEALAQAAEQSLNTWIVQAVRRAAQAPRTDRHNSSRRVTGWA